MGEVCDEHDLRRIYPDAPYDVALGCILNFDEEDILGESSDDEYDEDSEEYDEDSEEDENSDDEPPQAVIA